MNPIHCRIEGISYNEIISDKSEVAAAITLRELHSGEILNSNAEKFRKLAMVAGLSKSSDELRVSYTNNPNAFLETLCIGIESVDANENTIELLSGAIAMQYAIAAGEGLPIDYSEAEKHKRTLEIIAKRSDEALEN